jgi:putative flavoprotein involved in K+ transport
MKNTSAAADLSLLESLVEEGDAAVRWETAQAGRPAVEPEHLPVLVIGGGQAGLSVGYHLARLGVRFRILDGARRVGDSWRQRWDSLRLFSAARFDGLDGLPFPAPRESFPTKDQLADYLESYARRFQLPVELGVKVERVTRHGSGFRVVAGHRLFQAEQVVVAMANYQRPQVPAFAGALDPGLVQLDAVSYRNPAQLRPGPVLVVGAGNSGAEISLDLARARHRVFLSGRDVPALPFRHGGWVARLLGPFLFRVLFHRILTLGTPLGRKAHQGGRRTTPLIRTTGKDLLAAGVERVPRTTGAKDGLPQLEDGRVVQVQNVVWCTGFHPGFSWVEGVPLDAHGEPRQVRGEVQGMPGLYFVGLHFLYAMSSSMLNGVGRDARFVAERIAARVTAPAR